MKRLLSTALILSIAACSSTPTPAVQTAPPTTATEPAPATTTEPSVADAGAAEATTTPAADAGTAAATTPPVTTPPATTPPVTAGDPVVLGRAVYQRVCARCHEDGEDEGPTPNKRWAEARMRTLVRSGNRRMRAIPVTRLSDPDLDLLVSYFRSTHAIE